MLRDMGEMPIECANEMNVPVVCFLHEPDRENGLWSWSARNFMPRKECCGSSYRLEADTKEEILEALKKYVIPLYEVALENMKAYGENYYWEPVEPDPCHCTDNQGDEMRDWIGDGFGNTWSTQCTRCQKKGIYIVRHGKVQCKYCD